MTHVFGIDFNSLYPSAFSSIPHPFSQYTGHIMYTNEPLYLFIAEAKLKCLDERINDLINLPPVFRHHDIFNDEDVIGKYMYDNMISNKIHASKPESKLICLLDMCNEFVPFSSYFLWLLLNLGLVITYIKCFTTYTAHNVFNSFVTDHMQKLVDINDKSTGKEKFYKI